MIVMTYVGDRVDWAIMIARELETDVFYGYRLLPLLLSEEVIDMTSYVLELVLLYALLLVELSRLSRTPCAKTRWQEPSVNCKKRDENGPGCEPCSRAVLQQSELMSGTPAILAPLLEFPQNVI